MTSVNLQKIKKYDYAKSHRFSIELVSNESIVYTENGVSITAFIPFGEFFPCENVKEELIDISSYQFKALGKSFKIPADENPLSLDISFYDTINHHISKWLVAWKKSIYLENGRIRAVNSCIKKLKVKKYNNKGVATESIVYELYPEGKLVFQGTNQPSPLVKSISLVIIDSKRE